MLTRFKITITSLIIFAIIALVIIGVDGYRLLMNNTTEYSQASMMVLSAIIGFYSGQAAGYSEKKRQEDEA